MGLEVLEETPRKASREPSSPLDVDLQKEEEEEGHGEEIGRESRHEQQDGEDGEQYYERIGRIMRDCTILPSSATVRADLISPPLPPHLRSIIENEGYPAITRQGLWSTAEGLKEDKDRTGRAVRFEFDGCQREGEVERLLKMDARDRGLEWRVSLERMEDKSAEEGFVDDGGEGWEAYGSGLYWGSNAGKGSADGNVGGSGDGGERERKRERVWYFLMFDDEEDARRFVRYWHRRVVPFEREVDEVKATAELLW